jgi:putative ABC transport system substrate-binding protein
MIRRRQFIAGLGGVAAWPVAARAQQPKMPVIGLLAVAPTLALIAAFHRGLAETGYIEGRNVLIDSRIAPVGQLDRLHEFAADLVRRQVAVIVTPGSTPASLAAKAATTTIPVIFGNASDPIQNGLVASFPRPGGNATGFSELNVGPKRFGVLREMVPYATRFGVLVNPNVPFVSEPTIRDAHGAVAILGGQVEVFAAGTDCDIDAVFASFAQKPIDVLVVAPDALFYAARTQLAVLTARHAIPAIYWDRALVEAGGLMSYGSSVADLYRQVGIYAGLVLKGEKPADLPVLQPTKFELVINLKTAKALGLIIPETLLATADEVIQ